MSGERSREITPGKQFYFGVTSLSSSASSSSSSSSVVLIFSSIDQKSFPCQNVEICLDIPKTPCSTSSSNDDDVANVCVTKDYIAQRIDYVPCKISLHHHEKEDKLSSKIARLKKRKNDEEKIEEEDEIFMVGKDRIMIEGCEGTKGRIRIEPLSQEQDCMVQATPRYIDFEIGNVRRGKIELKISEKGFEQYDKNDCWKKTKIKLNLWDEQSLKIGQCKKIKARVKLKPIILQSALSFCSSFSFYVCLQINQMV